MNAEKKMVSVVVPIYNEVQMIDEIYSRVDKVFQNLDKYEYELVFFDDGSVDGTREAIEKLSGEHGEIKGVFYTKNFGYMKNTFYAMQQAKGDCAILLHADLQNPPEIIPEFIEKWENGAQVVLGVKNKSRENKLMYFLRTVFYFLMIHIFGVRLTPHATEFELFDKSFIKTLGRIKASKPFLRGIVSEFAAKTDKVYYVQDARKKGKSKFNLNKYYDFAICGITQYSVCLPRRMIFVSVIGIIASFLEFALNFLPNIFKGVMTDIGFGLIIRAFILIMLVFFIFVSFMFEYVISAVNSSSEKPLIIEEKRINY